MVTCFCLCCQVGSNEFDNVLYEIINEGGTREWDWFMVNFIHEYEQTKPLQHPVGLTGHGGETNDSMLSSPAEWFSPGASEWRDLLSNPRVADGRKVSILDTDHLWGEGGDYLWVWKSFLRGHNPIYMDRIAALTGDTRGDIPGAESARKAMGLTRQIAEQTDMAAMFPQSLPVVLHRFHVAQLQQEESSCEMKNIPI